METPKKLGIIGKNISYSFSKKYFENKFQNLMLKNYSYDIFDLNDISDVEEIFNKYEKFYYLKVDYTKLNINTFPIFGINLIKII